MDDKTKSTDDGKAEEAATDQQKPQEVGGSDKPDPVRYGDWEINGKCIDF